MSAANKAHPDAIGAVQKRNFWKKVKRIPLPSGCWLYRGASKNGHHGTLPSGEYAHRFSWRLTFGPIPNGKNVLHRCDVPRCVNPNHLFLGTQLDNIADMNAKGRGKNPPVHRGETHHNAKLVDEEISQMREMLRLNKGTNQRQLASLFGCSQSTVSRIWKGLTRK